MRDWGLPAPRFAETSNGFRVTLRGPGERLVGEEIDRAKWRRLDLNERQEAALEYIAKNQRITNKDFRDLFPDVSEETIRRDLADLVEQDVLLKMGDKKGTHYILK
jgi:ATP-dependent DNA helicase RecG